VERRGGQVDRRLLGDLLIEAGVIGRSALGEALAEQQLRGGHLGYALLRGRRVTPSALHLFLQDHLAEVSPDLERTMRESPAADLVPGSLAHHYGLLPVRAEGGVLQVALATADDPALLAALHELTGLRIDPVICPPGTIAAALDRVYPREIEPGVLRPPVGDATLVVSDRRRGLRPALPETLRPDAPSSAWLRALVAEAIRRGARRVRIEPEVSETKVVFQQGHGGEEGLAVPPATYTGLASLLLGLSGIAARGRVVPREGRLAIAFDGRRVALSVLALPGLRGDGFLLDFREPRVAPAETDDLAADMPDLAEDVAGLAARRRGLLLLAGPGRAEAAAGLEALLARLGDRLPARVALGAQPGDPSLRHVPVPADEETVPLEALLRLANAGSPDLVVLAGGDERESLAAALALARERAVIAVRPAGDACAAAEEMMRTGTPPADRQAIVGVVGVRLLERLCRACARPYDPLEVLSPWPRHRRPEPGSYHAAQGCDQCRGSGALNLEPVFEYLPGSWFAPARRPPPTAGGLRRERTTAGHPMLFQNGLRRAAAGRLDVREPLRLLLHEQH
jgi:hypothetical protein